jgi:hypothetical protein
MPSPRPLYSARVLVPLVLVVKLCSTGCAPYEWRQGERRYGVAEQGRVIELMDVSIRITGNPFNSWMPRLVEPCGTSSERRPDLPCWPQPARHIRWQLLRQVSEELPGYRQRNSLQYGERRWNPGLGRSVERWIIGTHPLAVAFQDDRPDVASYKNTARQATQPATEPDFAAIRAASASRILSDYAKLVSEADLLRQANVVLLFPEEMEVQPDDRLLPISPERPLHAKLFVLPQPRKLIELIRAVAQPSASASLTDMAEQHVEVPVRTR